MGKKLIERGSHNSIYILDREGKGEEQLGRTISRR